MVSPPHESPTLSYYFGINVEEDNGSDTDLLGEERTIPDSPVQEATPHTAPTPFAERGETTPLVAQHHATDAGECIITNPFDDQQELILQQEKRALRRTHTQTAIQNRSGYVFSTTDVEQRLRQTEGRSLATLVIGPKATSPEEIAFRKVLNERYLEPILTTQGQYKSHLESTAHGVSVRPIRACHLVARRRVA